jgi:hypothetical protein
MLSSLKYLLPSITTRPDARLENVEAHYPARDVLLRQQHAHDAVSALTIRGLDRVHRSLHVAEIFSGTGERSDDAIQILR